MAHQARLSPPCKCGNHKQDDFLIYRDDDDGLLGVFCTKCGMEWLKEKYLTNNDSDEFIRFHHVVLLLNTRRQATDEAFQVQYNRTKIQNEFAVDMLKAGDHIQWERPAFDHHAIVEKVNVDNRTIDVIEYQKVDFCHVEVIRDTLHLIQESEKNLYRIDYEDGVPDQKKLILSRARAWLGQTGYNLFTRNCETFSVYCEIGTLVSWQTVWFAGRVMRCIKAAFIQTCWQTGAEVAFGEFIERATTGISLRTAIGAGIVIAIEGAAVTFDVIGLYSQRKEGGMSKNDFLHNTIQRIIDGISTAGYVVGGAFAGQWAGGVLGTLVCPGAGTSLGMFIGSIIGGVIMGVPGKICGTLVGRTFGRAIVATVKQDDRLVRFADLQKGDQIVMCAWFFHPRCHAIVTEVNREERTMKVIRNTYEKGVKEELLDFVPPVYRVMYTASQRRSVEDTISRARSRLGETKYNLIAYNCKHFACWCIEK